MSKLRSYLMIGMLAVLGLGSECKSGRDALLTPDTFVGNYIYRSADQGAPHDPDKLTLRADGKYILIHMPGGHPGSTEEGKWELISKPKPTLVFGDRVYPVETKSKDVRLLINEDLGHCYEKTG